MSSLLESFYQYLETLGVPMPELVGRSGVVLAVIVLSILANFVAKRILLRGIARVVEQTSTQWDDIFFRAKVFDRLSHLAPALVIFYSAGVMFPAESKIHVFTERISLAYMVVIGCLVVNAFLNAVVALYRTFEISRQRPIKSFVQVAKVFAWLVTIILVVGHLVDKSPWALLGSLGIMTTVLMVVFKDSLLGFVAGIQLAGNNLVQRGDWIEMPKFGADGDVIDITLNTVKVQNWDKTISTIPSYALVSDSFKNWRGMSENSEGRRIKRALHIDVTSVRFLDEELKSRFKKFELLTEYIDAKEKEVRDHNESHEIDTTIAANGRRLTNLGTFRQYVKLYLKSHPDIHQGMTLLVRQLRPAEYGIPIEIYCFSSDKNWGNYEAIQADIFDHLLAVVPLFDLRVFQRPAGTDFQDAETLDAGDASEPIAESKRTSPAPAKKSAAKKSGAKSKAAKKTGKKKTGKS